MALIRCTNSAPSAIEFTAIGHDLQSPITVEVGANYVISGSTNSGSAITNVTGGDIVLADQVSSQSTEYGHILVVKATSTSLTVTGIPHMGVVKVSN